MKKLAKLGLLTLFIVGVSHLSPNLHDKFLFKYLNHYTVEVLNSTGNWRGSGSLFYHEGKSYVITAAHVCGRKDDKINIVSESFGVNERSKILAIDLKDDTCIVESPIDVSILGPKIADSSAHIEEIYYVGYPLVRAKFFSKGYLGGLIEIDAQIDKRESEAQCPVGDYFEDQVFIWTFKGCEFKATLNYASIAGFQGASGSGVTNMFGNIVGVVSRGSDQFTHTLLLTKLEDIKKLLKSIKE